MARCQRGELHAAAGKERVRGDEQSIRSIAHETCKRRTYFAAGAGVENLGLHPYGSGSRLYLFDDGIGYGTGRIDEYGYTSCSRHKLAQEFQPLCRQLSREKIDPCHVATWSG